MIKKILILVGALFVANAHDTMALTTEPVKSKPEVNPYLAGEMYAITHFNPAQSDAFPYPAAQGTFHVNLRDYPRVTGGPIGYMQLISTDPNYMWGLTTGGINYVDITDGGWKVVANYPMPETKLIPDAEFDKDLMQQFTTVQQAEATAKKWDAGTRRMLNNVYVLVDKDNILYSATGRKVNAYTLVDKEDPTKGIHIVRSYDFGKELDRMAKASNSASTKAYGMNIIGMSMTYDGNLVLLTGASVSVIDREFKNPVQTIRFGNDEHVSNSQCIDADGGIYVASDKMMRKLVWTGKTLSDKESDGAWASSYDFGEEPPAVKFGKGTGSTPSLMGFGDDEDKLVVITDGSNQMNIVAFWRNEIPSDAKQQPGTKSKRIAGQLGITCGFNPLPEFIQSEQSVVVNGYGAFVVNNIRKEGYRQNKVVDVLLGGPVYTPPVGCERVEWNPETNQWHSVWSRNDVVSTSMVPAVSSVSNIVFVNGYTPKDGWELTGMDWNSGKTVTRIIFGKDNLGNGAYATIQFLPNSDLLFNSIGGPVRVKLEK